MGEKAGERSQPRKILASLVSLADIYADYNI